MIKDKNKLIGSINDHINCKRAKVNGLARTCVNITHLQEVKWIQSISRGKIQYAGKYLADEEIEEAIEWITSKSHDNDFIIIIDDKSMSTVVGIIAATCAKRSIMILSQDWQESHF